jgi:hypothetical protein
LVEAQIKGVGGDALNIIEKLFLGQTWSIVGVGSIVGIV